MTMEQERDRSAAPAKPSPACGRGQGEGSRFASDGTGKRLSSSTHPDPPERLSKGPQAGEGTVGLRRRRFLTLLGAAAAIPAWGLPRAVFAAAPTDRRFVVVLLRGALDGLAAVPPLGERRYGELRGGLALPAVGPSDGFPQLAGD